MKITQESSVESRNSDQIEKYERFQITGTEEEKYTIRARWLGILIDNLENDHIIYQHFPNNLFIKKTKMYYSFFAFLLGLCCFHVNLTYLLK